MKILPISLDDLIHARGLESARREFKKAWNEVTRDSVIQTVCAFANDFQNLNGGYIVIGIEESGGAPLLPPSGLPAEDVDRIQREITGHCRRLQPEYQPVMSPEAYMGRTVLVLWAPGGDVRPYQAPEHGQKNAPRSYFVRLGSETRKATGDVLHQLMQLTARVPFDDRRRSEAPVSVISSSLVRQFLADVRSDHVAPGVDVATDILIRSLKLTSPVNGGESPRNVAILFFADDPQTYFPAARIEVVQFGDDAGGDLIEERVFRGPLPQQVRHSLDYLNGLSANVIRKVPGQAEAERFVLYPYEAMEEAVANAVHHRSYEFPPEPIRVHLYPDRLEITSYPGPVPGLDPEHLLPGAHAPALPMRNRRIGEFLKELRLAEMRNPGVPTIHRKMAENGSPNARFDFDVERTYFRVTLPAHPGYVVLHGLREAAALWATGERGRALERLAATRQRVPNSGALAAQMIDYASASGDLALAESVFAEIEASSLATDRHRAFLALARAYLDQQRADAARALLQRIPEQAPPGDALELAILFKRSGQLERAHQIFAESLSQFQGDPKALHEYAQTKLRLASKLGRPGVHGREARRSLNRDAAELLRRVIQLTDQPIRAAWAWFDLARALANLRAPETEIRAACAKAIELVPGESRFQSWLEQRLTRQEPTG